jgi:hypothetical protein
VVAFTPGKALPVPKVGLWMEMITMVDMAALKWRWGEDLAISCIRCPLTLLKVSVLLQQVNISSCKTVFSSPSWRILGIESSRATISKLTGDHDLAEEAGSR